MLIANTILLEFNFKKQLCEAAVMAGKSGGALLRQQKQAKRKNFHSLN